MRVTGPDKTLRHAECASSREARFIEEATTMASDRVPEELVSPSLITSRPVRRDPTAITSRHDEDSELGLLP